LAQVRYVDALVSCAGSVRRNNNATGLRETALEPGQKAQKHRLTVSTALPFRDHGETAHVITGMR
jgi:hypothetical protein